MGAVLYKWFFSGLLFLTVGTGSHPIYVSVTEIEHNATDKTLEISCKVFTDDFEKTLRQNYKTNIELIAPKDKAAMQRLVNDYLQKHFQIQVDGKTVALQFLDYEKQDEGIISYFQANNISSVKKMTVTDNILYDYKKEQVSVLHITVGGNRKSSKVNNPEDKVSVEF
jgi:hypothetical protein